VHADLKARHEAEQLVDVAAPEARIMWRSMMLTAPGRRTGLGEPGGRQHHRQVAQVVGFTGGPAWAGQGSPTAGQQQGNAGQGRVDELRRDDRHDLRRGGI
jgi:hypothetical protein